MAATMLGTKVRVSKNRKKYWRKHVNLNEVEEFLEEKRQDERFGSAAEKPDEQLFVVEAKSTRSGTVPRNRNLPLRCFQILQPDSAVPPPLKPPQLQGSTGKVKPPPTWSKNKKRQKIKTTPEGNKGTKQQKNSYDLWSEDSDLNNNQSKEKVLSGVDVDYLPDMVTRKTIKVPEYRYQKPSLLPAVETPHPGASYNPTYGDHQALLLDAHLVEVKKLKEEERLERSLTKKFPKELPSQQSWLEEMSAGLFETEEVKEMEEEKEDDTTPVVKTWGQPVSYFDRKTKADRNLEKVRKREKRKVTLEKIQKRRLNDLNGLKAMKKNILKAEAASEERIKKREKKRGESMYQARRIGPCKYVSPDLEIQLGEELPDSLRTLKTEGHLMEDRFKSLQRRNLIEPRNRQKTQKKKMKTFVKRSHRD